MSRSIEEVERMLVEAKEWKYMGEVDTRKRPKNSLLKQEEIDFEQGPPLIPFSCKQNDEIERITLQRIREGTFDNHTYNTKEKVEVMEEVYDTEDLEIKDIICLYNEIEGDLMKITDFGNNGFMLDSEVRIVEDEVCGGRKKPNTRSLDKIKNVTVLKK